MNQDQRLPASPQQDAVQDILQCCNEQAKVTRKAFETAVIPYRLIDRLADAFNLPCPERSNPKLTIDME